MKRPVLFIYSLIIAIVLACVAHARAQSPIPFPAVCVGAVGTAAAAVSCGPAASGTPQSNRLTGFTVMCGKASGAAAEATVTITGLNTVLTYYIDESQTAPTFVAEDFTYPAVAPSGAAITIAMPAVTNGGPCSCVACYTQY